MFATALAVALAGDHRATGAFPSDIARGQAEIDDRGTVFDTVRLVFYAAVGGVRSRAPLAEPLGRFLDRLRRCTQRYPLPSTTVETTSCCTVKSTASVVTEAF